jgi:hypothetical protein
MTQYRGPALALIRVPNERSVYWQARQQFSTLGDELARLADLKDGWDSYRAAAPSPASIATAERILKLLRSAMLPPSRIVPSAAGGIGICFIDADRYADIEIFNDQEILATAYRGRSDPCVWEVNSDTESITEAIRQIRAHFDA